MNSIRFHSPLLLGPPLEQLLPLRGILKQRLVSARMAPTVSNVVQAIEIYKEIPQTEDEERDTLIDLLYSSAGLPLPGYHRCFIADRALRMGLFKERMYPMLTHSLLTSYFCLDQTEDSELIQLAYFYFPDVLKRLEDLNCTQDCGPLVKHFFRFAKENNFAIWGLDLFKVLSTQAPEDRDQLFADGELCQLWEELLTREVNARPLSPDRQKACLSLIAILLKHSTRSKERQVFLKELRQKLTSKPKKPTLQGKAVEPLSVGMRPPPGLLPQSASASIQSLSVVRQPASPKVQKVIIAAITPPPGLTKPRSVTVKPPDEQAVKLAKRVLNLIHSPLVNWPLVKAEILALNELTTILDKGKYQAIIRQIFDSLLEAHAVEGSWELIKHAEALKLFNRTQLRAQLMQVLRQADRAHLLPPSSVGKSIVLALLKNSPWTELTLEEAHLFFKAYALMGCSNEYPVFKTARDRFKDILDQIGRFKLNPYEQLFPFLRSMLESPERIDHGVEALKILAKWNSKNLYPQTVPLKGPKISLAKVETAAARLLAMHAQLWDEETNNRLRQLLARDEEKKTAPPIKVSRESPYKTLQEIHSLLEKREWKGVIASYERAKSTLSPVALQTLKQQLRDRVQEIEPKISPKMKSREEFFSWLGVLARLLPQRASELLDLTVLAITPSSENAEPIVNDWAYQDVSNLIIQLDEFRLWPLQKRIDTGLCMVGKLMEFGRIEALSGQLFSLLSFYRAMNKTQCKKFFVSHQLLLNYLWRGLMTKGNPEEVMSHIERIFQAVSSMGPSVFTQSLRYFQTGIALLLGAPLYLRENCGIVDVYVKPLSSIFSEQEIVLCAENARLLKEDYSRDPNEMMSPKSLFESVSCAYVLFNHLDRLKCLSPGEKEELLDMFIVALNVCVVNESLQRDTRFKKLVLEVAVHYLSPASAMVE